ncbi:MAG: hypothetical protein KA954_08150 [Chitinophagales bacterium]|nr:hypothetical protein [Chitinophagales bacterium]MBP8754478.1 hypothetical protein [Chitinophagales bacterium]MBP9190088.1 hypothetical protein [Chitinophagales bacterium]
MNTKHQTPNTKLVWFNSILSSKLFIIFLFVLSLASCTKEIIEKTAIEENFELDQLIQRAKSLSSIHDNPTTFRLESGEDLNVESTNQLLEATLNYDFYSEEFEFEFLISDSFEISINKVESDLIAFENYVESYTDLFDFINSKISDTSLFVICDLSVKEIGVENISISAKLITAYPSPISTERSTGACDFNEFDYWYPMNDDGKCDYSPGDFDGLKDGSDRIEQKLPCGYSSPTCNSGYTKFYYNVSYVWDNRLSGSTPPNDLFYYYDTDCLTPSDLTEVRDASLYWANYYLPTGKVIKAMDIDYDFLVDYGSDTHWNYIIIIYYANYECIAIIE